MPAQTKVVVVDDEPAIVAVVCEVLEDEDIPAVPCEHGTTALCCIYQEQPTLVVLDVQMPGMDGIQIFQHMRAHPQTTTTPVIFLTANSHLVSRRLPNYKEMNAELLPKPFDLDSFIEVVYRFLPQ